MATPTKKGFGPTFKKSASNVKSSNKLPLKAGSVKPMKDCGCGGHGRK